MDRPHVPQVCAESITRKWQRTAGAGGNASVAKAPAKLDRRSSASQISPLARAIWARASALACSLQPI